MREAVHVAVVDGVAQLPEQPLRLRLAEHAVLVDVVREVAAVRQLHDDVQLRAHLHRVVQLNDVDVVEVRQDLHLLVEVLRQDPQAGRRQLTLVDDRSPFGFHVSCT